MPPEPDPEPDTEPAAALCEALETQAFACEALGSRLYSVLLRAMADDVRAGGPSWTVLAPYAQAAATDYHALRVLGGVHCRVLGGGAPDLARYYPSVGGDGDAVAAWPILRDLLAQGCPEIDDALQHPPQTNEVGRAAALIGGFLLVARAWGLPVRALEIGASAGLNLRLDHFRYEQGPDGWGRSDALVRFRDLWVGGTPDFGAPLEIVERAGCDRHPVDPTTPDGRRLLLSYVWPDLTERFDRMQAACETATAVPAEVEAADAVAWLPSRLAGARPGVATVVFHSVFWNYLTDEQRRALAETIHDAGARATVDAPLAWLRLEGVDTQMAYPELRLTTWPGGKDHHLADAHFHVGPIHWFRG